MTIAAEVQWTLPNVLTDYLNDLIVAETRNLDAALMECRLTVGQLGGRPVQQIEFLGKQHLVFGFPPVQCTLRVLISRGWCRLLPDGE